MCGKRFHVRSQTTMQSEAPISTGICSPMNSDAIPYTSAPIAGAARVIMPQVLRTRPIMLGEVEFCSSVWQEMP